MAVLLIVGPPPSGDHAPFAAEVNYMFHVEEAMDELKIASPRQWQWSPEVEEFARWATDQVTRVVT